MCKTLGFLLAVCLALGLTVPSVRAEDKAVAVITKLGGTVTCDERAAGKSESDEAAEAVKQTIPRPIWLLVDAKTQDRIQAGNRGLNNFMRPDIKQVKIPKASAARITLRNAKQRPDLNSERFPASLNTLAEYNREFAVKSVSVTLADNTVVECRALVRMEDALEVVLHKDIILALTIETAGDQGPQTWYNYVSVYEAPVAVSANPATLKKDLKGMQGTWKIDSSQHTRDMFLLEKDPQGLTVLVTGDTLTY